MFNVNIAINLCSDNYVDTGSLFKPAPCALKEVLMYLVINMQCTLRILWYMF